MTTLRHQMRYLNPYDLHKVLINEYIFTKPGATKIFARDTSQDKNDHDVLRENHKFLWDDSDAPDTWELQFAKKYYDKLFKEYCIADLTLYKENKLALRWRTEQEVVVGKGQFICGNKRCNEKDELRTWEVNFCYKENDEKKNALVKIRLCPNCSRKLNYRSKKREVKRLKRRKPVGKQSIPKPKTQSKSKSTTDSVGSSEEVEVPENTATPSTSAPGESEPSTGNPWEQHAPVELKSRDEEMEDYLQDLLL